MLRNSDLLLLKRLVRFWQRKLGLTQWAGSVAWDTGGVLKQNIDAEIEWDPDHMTFRILFSPGLNFTNLNITIVHELLHLADWQAENELQEHKAECPGFAYGAWSRIHDIAITHVARAFVAHCGTGPVEITVRLEAEIARKQANRKESQTRRSDAQ